MLALCSLGITAMGGGEKNVCSSGDSSEGRQGPLPFAEAVATPARPTPVATSCRQDSNVSRHKGQTQSILRRNGLVLRGRGRGELLQYSPRAGRQQTELERLFHWAEVVAIVLVVSRMLWLKARSWSRHFLKLPQLGDFMNESQLTSSRWLVGGREEEGVKNVSWTATPQDFSTPPIQSRPLAFPHSDSFCPWTRHRGTSWGIKSLKIFSKNVITLKPCVTQQILHLFPKLTPAVRSLIALAPTSLWFHLIRNLNFY